MSERFEVVDINPNQTTGGGGCLCSEVENPDCKGPFAVFPHQEMASNLSPHAVLCLGCAEAVVKQADRETLAGGESVADELIELLEEAADVVDELAEELEVKTYEISDGEVEEIPEV